jgi:Fur family ferric uptake transcriptional regulator
MATPNHLSATDADQVVAQVAERLRAHGGRMTHSRRAVLTALAQNPGYWTNDEVEAFVAEIDPSVHRSSVYRTLSALSKLDAIQHVHVGHGNTVFRLASPVGVVLLHIQCRSCEKILEVPGTALDELKEQLAREHGFILHPDHAALSGLCAECSTHSENQSHGHSH